MGGDLSNFSCLSSGVNGCVSHPRGTRIGPSERRALGQLPLGRLLRKGDCQVLRHVLCSGALPLLFLSLSLLRSFPRELSVHQRLRIGRRVLCGLWLSRLDGEPINQSIKAPSLGERAQRITLLQQEAFVLSLHPSLGVSSPFCSSADARSSIRTSTLNSFLCHMVH